LNRFQLQAVIDHFDLGTLKDAPPRVYGGLLHFMWHLETSQGSYAVKQLSSAVNLTDHKIVENYNLTEKIAARFTAKGIPAVSAIEISEEALCIIDGVGFMVYPWVHGQSLDDKIVLPQHALKISTLLARMHNINLDIPELLCSKFDTHENDKIVALVRKALKCVSPVTGILNENLSDLLILNDMYHQSIVTLKEDVVVSHGDLDQKNILWDNDDNPILIDWESACKINTTYDIVNACLDWSGITTKFNHALFIQMISAYQQTGGKINKSCLDAAFYGVIGNWINWLVYNIERSCNLEDVDSQKIGIEQTMLALTTILKLKILIPELIKNIKQELS